MYLNRIQKNTNLMKVNLGILKERKQFFKLNNCQSDVFVGKNNIFNFRGKPESIDYDDFILSEDKKISAKQAICIYECLKYHKYTDIPQPNWYNYQEPPFNEIREHNLRFLDQIDSVEDKKEFIDYYEKLTGFPNLKTCSQKILNEFYNAATGGVRKLAGEGIDIKIADIGYNDTCSVGHTKALPGSDIDGGYVILDTSNSGYYDSYIVNRFKEYLWNNTDQRILSYNHLAAFPQVYTKSQADALLKSLETKTQQMNLSKKIYSRWFFKKVTMLSHYKNLLKTYNPDYVNANEFCIELSKTLENKRTQDYISPSKELAKNFGYLTETIINGKSLLPNEESTDRTGPLYNKFHSTLYANLVNLSQLQAIKSNPQPKPKLVAREKLIEKYLHSSIEEKYEIIREIIRASCGHNNNEKFSEYFACGNDNYTPLLNALKGN